MSERVGGRVSEREGVRGKEGGREGEIMRAMKITEQEN